ncbi:Flp pilus assembly protein CpaB [Aurantiacibacter odishensis]|uniref:Flp pilus assembly protein CpaB n=1 Tax=Aurantiacibacter odishensis TaxID=1155476 RepID=UPI000E707860|nr:Flp pilus assembly protein CpaB [Aurantiacibacter odishensis]
MNQRNIIILVVAGVLGILAVYLANTWFSGVEERQAAIAEQQELVNVAVASQELEFGTALNNDNIRLVSWPANSVPEGAFNDLSAIEPGQVAIRPIAIGEPILQSRISGRASLSANLPVDMRAVSIPVNQVSGVAGFVLPGDVVDVMLTRDNITTVLLENVPVLAIDRRADDQSNEPAVVDTATLQLDPVSAQRITLARQVGSLSLALRNVENQEMGPRPRVTVADLGYFAAPQARVRAASNPSPARSSPSRQSSGATVARAAPPAPRMTINRGTETAEYEVPRYGSR